MKPPPKLLDAAVIVLVIVMLSATPSRTSYRWEGQRAYPCKIIDRPPAPTVDPITVDLAWASTQAAVDTEWS
jgi:hypothetical protein